jgi:hypothetical protein
MRTYRMTWADVWWTIPAVHLALLLRQYATAEADYKGNTLLEAEIFGY